MTPERRRDVSPVHRAWMANRPVLEGRFDALASWREAVSTAFSRKALAMNESTRKL